MFVDKYIHGYYTLNDNDSTQLTYLCSCISLKLYRSAGLSVESGGVIELSQHLSFPSTTLSPLSTLLTYFERTNSSPE